MGFYFVQNTSNVAHAPRLQTQYVMAKLYCPLPSLSSSKSKQFV